MHSLHVSGVENLDDIRMQAGALSVREGFAQPGDCYVAIAGLPFGSPGSTNLMHIGLA